MSSLHHFNISKSFKQDYFNYSGSIILILMYAMPESGGAYEITHDFQYFDIHGKNHNDLAFTTIIYNYLMLKLKL